VPVSHKHQRACRSVARARRQPHAPAARSYSVRTMRAPLVRVNCRPRGAAAARAGARLRAPPPLGAPPRPHRQRGGRRRGRADAAAAARAHAGRRRGRRGRRRAGQRAPPARGRRRRRRGRSGWRASSLVTTLRACVAGAGAACAKQSKAKGPTARRLGQRKVMMPHLNTLC
jgi:hypothetical protein